MLHAQEGMGPDLPLILKSPGLQGLKLQLLCWLSSFKLLCSVAPLLWTHWFIVKEFLLPPNAPSGRTGSHSRNGKGDGQCRQGQASKGGVESAWHSPWMVAVMALLLAVLLSQ